jgi:hypothetical protein
MSSKDARPVVPVADRGQMGSRSGGACASVLERRAHTSSTTIRNRRQQMTTTIKKRSPPNSHFTIVRSRPVFQQPPPPSTPLPTRPAGSRPGSTGSRPGSRGGVSASLEFGDPPPKSPGRTKRITESDSNEKKTKSIPSNDWRNGGTRGMRKGLQRMGLDDTPAGTRLLTPVGKTATTATTPGRPARSSRSSTSKPPGAAAIPSLASRPTTGFRERRAPKMSAVAGRGGKHALYNWHC